MIKRILTTIYDFQTIGPHTFGYSLSYLILNINPKYYKEYRCPTCNKLLAKGQLIDKDTVLEVKCKNCHELSVFKGEDAEIIKVRSQLLKEGKIPDTDMV